ncbi:MAG TPA: TonB-dependent receptor [Caulobacteraceae bacterium]|nr:TonB-dependent receptor [Caulobacteraceae bacterium]
MVDAPDVQVIDRQEIDARQAVQAADVLDTVPGLALARNGAFGGVTSIRMRGASADKTLVLIDGVPQNDPSDPNGAYDFANLDLASVEKIEILQGPQSSLWGSDAIGGVIALTTRELDGWRAQAEGGTLASYDASAAAGRRTDGWAAGVSASGVGSDGVSRADGFPERDPYTLWNASGYARASVGDRLVIDGRIAYDDSRTATDGYDANFVFGDTPEFATYHSWTGDLRARLQGPQGFTETFTLGGYALDRAALGNPVPSQDSRFNGARQDYRWTAERGEPDDVWGVVFGAERVREHGSLSTGGSLSLGTTSGFAVARLKPLPILTLTGALRYDAPDTFSGQATGHASAVLKLPAGLSVEGAWGQGFKTPTISEIFCDFCFPGGPSLDLRPEHAEGWDAALAWASADGRIKAKVTGYRLAVRDQIEFSPAFPFRYVNLDRTRTNGLEAEVDVRLTHSLSAHAGYAYTDARDLDAGAQLVRVPRNTGSVGLDWAEGRWQANVTVRAEGEDADIDPSTFAPAIRPGFVVANIAGAYELTRWLQLTARVEDVADRRYEEVLGYGEPKRMVWFGVRAKG